MAGSEFDDFVRRQQAKAQEGSRIDVAEQLAEWRDSLSKLYIEIEGYMSDYLGTGQATTRYQEIELNEQFSGPYTVRELELTIGPSIILFKPIGTMLIGAKGRVDVHGPLGDARLVYMDRNVEKSHQLFRVTESSAGVGTAIPSATSQEPIEWAWKIATPAPHIRFTNLHKESFFDMILSIADA